MGIKKGLRLFFIYVGCLFVVGLLSCNNQSKNSDNLTFEVSEFDPLSNYHEGSREQPKVLYLDYDEAIDSGFVVPSIHQTKEAVFVSRFKIKNKSEKSQRYY